MSGRFAARIALRLREAIADDARHHRHLERRRALQRNAEQVGELGEVGDAGEDVDQHHAHAGPLGDPAQCLDQAGRVVAQQAGPNIQEIQWLAAARGHLVDQHHRQAGAGGDKADLALRIDLDVVEAVVELADGVRIDRSAALDQSARSGCRCTALRSTTILASPATQP